MRLGSRRGAAETWLPSDFPSAVLTEPVAGAALVAVMTILSPFRELVELSEKTFSAPDTPTETLGLLHVFVPKLYTESVTRVMLTISRVIPTVEMAAPVVLFSMLMTRSPAVRADSVVTSDPLFQ